MPIAYGGAITLDKAIELGVLDTAEALISQGPDKPMKVVTPADRPAESKGEDDMADEQTDISLHRALHHLNRGGLHRALGVPEGQDIPADKLEAAKHSNNQHVRHMANFAATMGRFKH